MNPATFGSDLLGYAAALLVLATFLARSMTTLRASAITSNLMFIAYALMADVPPVLLLHALLLPLNAWRLWQAMNETAPDSGMATGLRSFALGRTEPKAEVEGPSQAQGEGTPQDEATGPQLFQPGWTGAQALGHTDDLIPRALRPRDFVRREPTLILPAAPALVSVCAGAAPQAPPVPRPAVANSYR